MQQNLSSPGDTCEAKPFWLRCIDCGGAVATAAIPFNKLDPALPIIRPIFKMLALKWDASPEVRAIITGENPFALLSDSRLVGQVLNLRCADCTVRLNGNVEAA